jgi:hypothetical protein
MAPSSLNTISATLRRFFCLLLDDPRHFSASTFRARPPKTARAPRHFERIYRRESKATSNPKGGSSLSSSIETRRGKTIFSNPA